jgi:hypothetical protein
MSRAALARWLEEQGAHHDIVEWAQPYDVDWEHAWNECPRGDWLLALAAKCGVERSPLVRAACACAELAVDYLPEDEPRPNAALDAAQRWLDGNRESRDAALADVERAIGEAPDAAVAAAAMAAFAALRSIDAPEEAATAAAAVVQAAVADAGHCAMMAAMSYAQRTCADRVRQHVPFSAIEPAAN